MAFLFSSVGRQNDSNKNNVFFGSSDTTKIIKMSQDISGDWLRREAEIRVKKTTQKIKSGKK